MPAQNDNSRSPQSSSGSVPDSSEGTPNASDFPVHVSTGQFSSNNRGSGFDGKIPSSRLSVDDDDESEEDSTTWVAGEVDPLGARKEAPLLDSAGRISEEAASFKEAIPFIKTFLDQKENEQRTFTHHSPVVYTRAPSREAPLTKKIVLPAEIIPPKLKKNKQQKPPSRDNSVELKVEKTASDTEEPGLSMRMNKVELLKLQTQVEELKLKVRDKEEILQSIKQAETKLLEEVERSESAELRSRVEKLQSELLKRDFVLHSLQHQLSEKHVEIGNMKLLLQGLQNEIVRRDHRVCQMENDLDELRFEVAALKSQGQIGAESPRFVSQTPLQNLISEELSCLDEQGMEEARNNYLAAVLAAKTKPVDESIALAAELRHRLRDFISLSQAFPDS